MSPAKLAVATLVLAIVAIGCAPEPLEFADWTIPVPEGTRIVEYANVAEEDRVERIELVEDLVLGDVDDPNELFYRLAGLAVDDGGQIYVLDRGNYRVQVFDAEGDHVRTIGQRGDGPGELRSPSSIAVAGDSVLVSQRLAIDAWSVDGAFRERLPTEFSSGTLGTGFPDGSAILSSFVLERWTDADDRTYSAARSVISGLLSGQGELIRQYAQLPYRQPIYMKDGCVAVPNVPHARPATVGARSGDVYVVAGDQYQMLAMTREGEARWALRVNRPTPALPEQHVDAALGELRCPGAVIQRLDIEWPERLPAIANLSVDGHGHVYVYPFSYVPWGEDGLETVPVDVYSADGERLFAGTIAASQWAAARADHVYSVDMDKQTGEWRVVRYRVVEPFE